ncbi:hypothetical protein VD0002_g6084 [Verticillium dahliae]|nr:hypothetical protein VD0003_g7220 [Verticillium dahliae]PNH61812.1 hypothetical protein VD0002_g6084 [Verticillium dahliae]
MAAARALFTRTVRHVSQAAVAIRQAAFEKQPRDGLMIEMHRSEKSGPACR